MLSYAVRRAGGAVLVLVLVLTLVFLMLHAAPGGPETAYLGTNPTPEKRAAVMEQLGLDRPLWAQYLTFVGSIVTLDLGASLTTGTPVSELLGDRMLVTLELGLLSFVVWTAVGMVAGALAAARRGKSLDAVVRVGSVVALSVPSFWLGLILVMVFGLHLPGVLPSSGWATWGDGAGEHLRSMVLPAFTLGLGAAGVIARTLRTSMVEALDSDHVAFGRAMGLGERTLLTRIALRNAVIPTVTVVGMMLGTFVGGAVLVENVFNVPGVGQLVVSSFLAHDYPVAIAATVWTAGTFLAATLVVDLLYFAIDPRIRAQFLGRSSR